MSPEQQFAAAVEEVSLAVPGGELAVLRWPAADPGAPTVLALHGITANGLAWGRVAGELAGRVTLLAPDLRGRAGSAAVAPPYGLARHADDAALIIRQFGSGGPLLVAGHSMGAWVAALLAVRHPELVRQVLLVDGAVSFPLPAGLAEREVLAAVLGPAVARLSMTFADLAAYRAFWQRHPAWPSVDAVAGDAYIARDLVGTEPELRSSCVREAVEVDGGQVLLDADAAQAVRLLSCPAELLWAERGLLDDAQALYDEKRLADAALAGPGLVTTRVPDSNHYSILMGEAGAPLVARRILAAAGLT
ncbi:alpha/beta hydrolase [Kitasatospora sp. NBC_01287]|uniref:alpha/beta hydrolase n=1 Tax=Kitasatospora sp. NBC_01287 TaxID=2903573 RepID=UPI0022519D7C|nr:alpha/beta hydrolase [Kitasatospora sp. NBC_01287]MCX4748814.1 alpha/beta hydrolase [Kitasatospora sp. NBC_01287]